MRGNLGDAFGGYFVVIRDECELGCSEWVVLEV